MKKMICAMIMVLGMVMMIGCNGANDKEEATDNDELYRVNIEDPISGCRVERGNKIYSLSGYVSAEKAEEFGVIEGGFHNPSLPYAEQFRDDDHQYYDAVMVYRYHSEGVTQAGDFDPITIEPGEIIISEYKGLEFIPVKLNGYLPISEDGTSVGRFYKWDSASDVIIEPDEENGLFKYDTSLLEPGCYFINSSNPNYPSSWTMVITIE